MILIDIIDVRKVRMMRDNNPARPAQQQSLSIIIIIIACAREEKRREMYNIIIYTNKIEIHNKNKVSRSIIIVTAKRL